MRTLVQTSAVCLAGVLALCAGCAADNPADMSAQRDFGPDAGVDGDAELGPVPLDVDSVLTSTPWSVIPVAGRGPANGLLVFGVPALGQDTYPLGSTGEFCVDVALLDGANTIRFEAISADGEHSDPVLIDVMRQGTPPDPEPVDPGGLDLEDRTPGTTYLGNYAVDAFGWTTYPDGVTTEQGSFAELVDGNKSKVVTFSSLGVGNGEVIAYSLPDPMSLYALDVTVPAKEGETCAPEGYEIWVSNDPNPELALDGVHWFMVGERTAAQTQAGAGTYHDELSLPGFPAQHIALRMTDSSCVKWFSTEPRTVYGINELRVIAASSGDDAPPPVDAAPSCARGGF